MVRMVAITPSLAMSSQVGATAVRKRSAARANSSPSRIQVANFNEATSQLDSENEAAIQRALAEALAGRTSLVIAHRLSTITTADQILVMDEGRIVESGVGGELLAAGGLYADLSRTLVREDVEHAVAHDSTALGLA